VFLPLRRRQLSAKLSVIFYIILCLEIGIFLTVAPWWPHGMWGISDWGNNYFLLYAARKTGIQGLQAVVASGWVRGAVSGVGLLNLGIAFWEIFNFKRTVVALQNETSSAKNSKNNAAEASSSDSLSDNERRDENS
jgi:hypothetical protein